MCRLVGIAVDVALMRRYVISMSSRFSHPVPKQISRNDYGLDNFGFLKSTEWVQVGTREFETNEEKSLLLLAALGLLPMRL